MMGVIAAGSPFLPAREMSLIIPSRFTAKWSSQDASSWDRMRKIYLF